MKPALLGSRCPAEVKDREMRRLLAGEAILNLVLGCALAPMKAGLHVRVGSANWKDYCREHLGMSAPAATSLVERVQAVRDRPVLLRALAEGRLGEEAASALLRSLPLDGSADSSWLDRARLPLPRLRRELDLAEQRGEFAPADAETGVGQAATRGELASAGAESGVSHAETRGGISPGALEGGEIPAGPTRGPAATPPLVEWIRAHAKARPAAARSQAAAPRGDGEWWVYCLTDSQYSELLICEEFACKRCTERVVPTESGLRYC